MVSKKKMKKAVKKVAKKVVKSAIQKATNVTKPFTKSQIAGQMAACANITKAQASLALEGLIEAIALHMRKKGPGEFVLPGLAKMKRVFKPATKARQGINPFTGEQTVFAAKPACNVVKIRPLKKLKDIVTK